MDLSPAKLEVLEALFLYDDPVKAAQISKDTGKDRRVVQMHLIGLVRMDYAETPKKGLYVVSMKGKEELGLREVTKEKALTIMAKNPPGKSFHFYSEVGKPLNVYATDLFDFCNKMDKVDVESIEFHFDRGDFEAWVMFLGDEELSKKMGLLRRKRIVGKELCEKIRRVTEHRCRVLAMIAEQANPFP